ncbi:MAG: transposase [Fusobacteriaceae bacterium]
MHKWVRKYKSTSSFRDEDQLTPEQKEIRELKKK